MLINVAFFFLFLEIRYIIVLFVLITLVWLCAGFHLAYGNEWILILFVVCDGSLVRTHVKNYIHYVLQDWITHIYNRQNEGDFLNPRRK